MWAWGQNSNDAALTSLVLQGYFVAEENSFEIVSGKSTLFLSDIYGLAYFFVSQILTLITLSH